MKPKDKGYREVIAKVKQLKRCNNLGLDPNINYQYKNHGKPCSCGICRKAKFNRKEKHKNKLK